MAEKLNGKIQKLKQQNLKLAKRGKLREEAKRALEQELARVKAENGRHQYTIDTMSTAIAELNQEVKRLTKQQQEESRDSLTQIRKEMKGIHQDMRRKDH